MGMAKVVVVLLALVWLVWRVHQLLRGRASQQWKRVTGKVLEVRVDEKVTRDRYGEHVYYSAVVRYSYSVGGRHFESHRLTFDPTTDMSYDDANNLVTGISEGMDIDVFHDPTDWDEAVLLTGNPRGLMADLGIPLLFFAAAIVFALWSDPAPRGMVH